MEVRPDFTKEALDKVIHGSQAERLFLCEKDFKYFFAYYLTDYVKYRFALFHIQWFKDLANLMNGKYRELALIAFRESAKTSIAKGFITWLICYGKRHYINVDSFDKENSERILFDIVLELQTNARIKADFGELFNTKRDPNEITQKRISNFITSNGIRVEAHSTQESVRGRLHGHQRPDCLLLDDFETNKTKDSQAYTEQVVSHINEFKAGLDSTAIILYLGNYITEHGSIQTLLDRSLTDPRLKVRNVPVMIDDKPTWADKYAVTDEEAKATGKVSLEDKQKQLGSYVFSYEMMNQPIDESQAEFKRERIQHITDEEVKKLDTLCYITIDSAVSEKESADYTGVTINRISTENKWYVYTYRLKINTKELVEHLFYLNKTYRPQEIALEETVFTLAIKPFLEDEMRKRNTFFNVIPLKHRQQQKETRIRGLIPRWETGSIFLVGPNIELQDEMRTFPHGANDDLLDSLSYQLQIALKPYKEYDPYHYMAKKEKLNKAR